jgi:hypothetical protein
MIITVHFCFIINTGTDTGSSDQVPALIIKHRLYLTKPATRASALLVRGDTFAF